MQFAVQFELVQYILSQFKYNLYIVYFKNIKKYMFDNEFHLLLNATSILMHASLGIITQYLTCGI